MTNNRMTNDEGKRGGRLPMEFAGIAGKQLLAGYLALCAIGLIAVGLILLLARIS